MATAAPARLNPIGARKNKTTTSTEEKEKKKVPERKRSRSPIKREVVNRNLALKYGQIILQELLKQNGQRIMIRIQMLTLHYM